MSKSAKRVALLARPGVACDRLRGALADAGAELVLEADPRTLDPSALDAVQAEVVLVALDAQTEEALDRFESALHDPAVEVIFEEADLAAHREGWEAARWVRHLAAKLHRHGDVLPPGGEFPTHGPADADANRPAPSLLDLDAAFQIDDAAALPAIDKISDGPEPAGTLEAFEPLFTESTFGDDAAPIERDDQAETVTPHPSSAFDPSLNFSYDFDSVSAEYAADGSATLVVTAAVSDFDAGQDTGFALDDLSLDAIPADGLTHTSDPGFDAMFLGSFDAPGPIDAEAMASLAPDADDVADGESAVPDTTANKRVLELVSDDGEQTLHAGPGADGAEVNQRFRHDLASLESRIAGMELVDDRIAQGADQANGAVLVLAGIGGPDAVRQLLAALPEDFPRPVLVQQRLDGGRYDKLVAQMQRATAMLVKLAEPGLRAIAGVIYILPAGICIKVADTGIQFTDGDQDILATLPSADSAVLLLSGSDPAQLDAVMSHSLAGALVMGQSPDGCYDAEAPNALLARGGGSGQPAELAERLSARWRS